MDEGRTPRNLLLIGAGGIGTQLTELLVAALRRVNHSGTITLMDADTVEADNLGHQRYTEGDIGQAHGFSIVQQIKSTGTDMYAGYRHVSLDRDTAGGTAGAEIDFEDQDIWVLGFRARF